MKKLLSLLLIFIMVLSVLPAEVFILPTSAAVFDDLSYEISEGKVTITDCELFATGALTIPKTIEGYPVTAIDYDVFRGCEYLTSVTIPTGVVTIGESAFEGCSRLTSIIIPDGVTVIGTWAFYECTSLNSVTIPNSVTTIGGDAFYGCDNLNRVFYQGTKEDRNRIYIKGDNSNLTSASWFYSPFKDIKKGEYYYTPVLWAVENGITSGTSKTEFSPNASCTRGQIATFLWRAAGCPKPATSKNPFKDVKKSDYYYKAVLWAVGKGITSGTSKTTFSPNDPCTRGQIAAFLWRANGSTKPKTSKNPFTDVKKSDFYYKAVLWAVENGITSGTTKTTFGPSEPCTRGQIATFLYRAYN